MNKFKVKVLIPVFMLILLSSLVYANNDIFSGEVDEPIAERNNNISEGIIISKNNYKEYNPLHPYKQNIDLDEYEKVNNYIIDLNTIESRIKYFSPTYNNIKSNAESMYWMSFYARGGNDTLVYDYKNYSSEVLDVVNEYKDTRNQYILERNNLDKKATDYEERYNDLTSKINEYNAMYKAALNTYNSTNKSILGVKSALGLNRVLYSIGNIDNNGQVAFARRAIVKSLSSVVLTYLQLNSYVDILEKQTNLYNKTYKITSNNLSLGLATEIDVKSSLDSYERTKNTYNSSKNTLKNLKEQIAINLGYSLSEIDKLVFIEPDIDYNYLNSIDIEKDKERVYTSNSIYNAIKLSSDDKKYPQSTGENLFYQRQTYTANRIINEFENIYENLKAKKISYDANKYLDEVISRNKESNLIKFKNDVVSEVEFNGLELQNLSLELQSKVAKYDLINAINEYYYAALGHITFN